MMPFWSDISGGFHSKSILDEVMLFPVTFNGGDDGAM